MWPQIEQDLARLLSSKLFPALRGVAAYDALLNKATGLPDAAACKAAANRIVNSTDLKTGIRGVRQPRTGESTRVVQAGLPRSRSWKEPERFLVVR